mmetsp:Transcript_35180/g.73882  ORF Transcript_35180/g.73882 Transcript_35180/m.73882 type:complete len:335 (+) Transcript_35180:1724-2728(+)
MLYIFQVLRTEPVFLLATGTDSLIPSLFSGSDLDFSLSLQVFEAEHLEHVLLPLFFFRLEFFDATLPPFVPPILVLAAPGQSGSKGILLPATAEQSGVRKLHSHRVALPVPVGTVDARRVFAFLFQPAFLEVFRSPRQFFLRQLHVLFQPLVATPLSQSFLGGQAVAPCHRRCRFRHRLAADRYADVLGADAGWFWVSAVLAVFCLPAHTHLQVSQPLALLVGGFETPGVLGRLAFFDDLVRKAAGVIRLFEPSGIVFFCKPSKCGVGVFRVDVVETRALFSKEVDPELLVVAKIIFLRVYRGLGRVPVGSPHREEPGFVGFLWFRRRILCRRR